MIKKRKEILVGVGIGAMIVVAFLLVFIVGVHIGSRKAGMPAFWEDKGGRDFMNGRFGHGTSGVIDSIGNNSLVVKDKSGALVTILVDDKTTVRRDSSAVKFTDLKRSEQVIVIGEPQKAEGAILAKVVRVFSSPAQASESGNFGMMGRDKVDGGN